MSILSGIEIINTRQRTQRQEAAGYPVGTPALWVEPFDPAFAGPNSYDVHLAPTLRVYKLRVPAAVHADAFQVAGIDPISAALLPYGVDSLAPPETVDLPIPPDGLWLYPNVLYLGSTVERTLCHGLVPWLDGRSSIGRLGLSLHVTAGRGDDGWSGQWTLEITAVAHPVKIRPNIRCGQITFFHLVGERKPYAGRYQDQRGPTSSRLHEE